MARTFPGSVFQLKENGAVHLQDFPGKPIPSPVNGSKPGLRGQNSKGRRQQ